MRRCVKKKESNWFLPIYSELEASCTLERTLPLMEWKERIMNSLCFSGNYFPKLETIVRESDFHLGWF